MGASAPFLGARGTLIFFKLARLLYVWESGLFDEAVEHAFLARSVEIDRQLVALDGRDIAVPELDMEDPISDRKFRGRVGH